MTQKRITYGVVILLSLIFPFITPDPQFWVSSSGTRALWLGVATLSMSFLNRNLGLMSLGQLFFPESQGQELYQWMDLNKKVRMLRTEHTNDPSQIARQAKMTSINSALEVDLFDQANASHVRGKIYSGFGGSTDFIVGALHSRGGRSFVALPSWHPKANVSTIVPRLSSNVTHFQHSFVVTEQGVAASFGHSQSEQAINIINNAAHPSVRDELTAKATEFGLI
jgi:acyl-CoA hydrolase